MTESEPHTDEKQSGSSMIGRLLIVGFIGAVVISECVFAYFWLPSAEEVAQQVQLMATQAATDGTGDEASREDEALDTVEVELGKFAITNHRQTDTTIRIDFNLAGTVTEDDLDEFQELFERNENRFRDLVIQEILGCGIDDLEDSGLGLIKRKILEKTNRALGKPLLHEAIFSKFSFLEQ